MRVLRFYSPVIAEPGQDMVLSAEESRHAGRVLRLRPGDTITLLDGAGTRAEATLCAAGPGGRREPRIACRVTARQAFRPPPVRVRLLVAPPRGNLMGELVRVATELGVWRITPILCRFGVARPDPAGDHSGWQDVAVAAIKQSGNVFLPRLDPPSAFGRVVEEASGWGYFGALPAEKPASPAPLPDRHAEELALWIGPEGGFAAEEEQALRDHGYEPVSVGAWTLRVETAVPSLLGWLAEKVGHDHLLCERI